MSHDDQVPSVPLAERAQLAPTIDTAERALEFLAPRARCASHVVDLVILRRAVGAPRTPIGLTRREVEQVIASLQRILAAAPTDGPPVRSHRASEDASPPRVAAPPARPPRADGLRRPGQPPESWTAVQRLAGAR